MISTNNIDCDLDFAADGKRLGNLALKYSNNALAFSTIPIPIAVIKNGDGPSLLLTAGNHGDEYEGQILLRQLIHELEPSDINGCLIILPALNYPAVIDGSRVSPLDQGNLNRSFPGNENGSPTAAIAHFVTTRLLPLCDAGVDLHSGGSRTYYLPCGFLCTSSDKDVMQRSLAMSDAFDAPFTFVVDGSKSPSGFDPVAHNLGIPFISSELSGGANVDSDALEIGRNGLINIIRLLGIQPAEAKKSKGPRLLDGINGCHTVTAPYSGIFEPHCDLGDQVESGKVAGVLHSLEEIERTPTSLEFEFPGIVVVRRNGALVERGSHLFMTAQEMSRAELHKIIND